jgi:hypothetical protein
MKAAAAMVEDLEMTLRQSTDEAKLTKKINNMKAAVKKKTDLNATDHPCSVGDSFPQANSV